MNDLKPCPFCGGEAQIEHMSCWVECQKCYAASVTCGEEQAAIDAWNTRVERTCEFKPFKDEDWSEPNAVRGVCSECSALMYGKDRFCPNCGAKVEQPFAE